MHVFSKQQQGENKHLIYYGNVESIIDSQNNN